MKKIVSNSQPNCPARLYPHLRRTSGSFTAIFLMAAIASPVIGQTELIPLSDEVLDQVSAGGATVQSAADAAATGHASLALTGSTASAHDHLCRVPLTVGYAQGGSLAFGKTAQTNATSSGATPTGLILSAGVNSHSTHGTVSISVSYHATVAFSF